LDDRTDLPTEPGRRSQQLLEVGPRSERLERRVAPQAARVAVTRRDGLLEEPHGLVGVALALGALGRGEVSFGLARVGETGARAFRQALK